jgi:hypothetical protein
MLSHSPNQHIGIIGRIPYLPVPVFNKKKPKNMKNSDKECFATAQAIALFAEFAKRKETKKKQKKHMKFQNLQHGIQKREHVLT